MTPARDAGALLTGAVAEGVGRLLAVGSWLRRARVFHPYGVVCTAELAPVADTDRLPAVHTVLFGAGHGPRPALVRLSKSAGTPGALPDVLGLAIRLGGSGGDRPVDLLFATTTAAGLLLAPATDWTRGRYGTLLPYRADGATVWLAARPRPTGRAVPASLDDVRAAAGAGQLAFTIAVARPVGGWRPVATLTVTGLAERDVSFDPVLNAHPLLDPVPRWLAQVRRTAYEHSRRARRAPDRSLTA